MEDDDDEDSEDDEDDDDMMEDDSDDEDGDGDGFHGGVKIEEIDDDDVPVKVRFFFLSFSLAGVVGAWAGLWGVDCRGLSDGSDGVVWCIPEQSQSLTKRV